MKSLITFTLLLLALPLFGIPQKYDIPIALVLIIAIALSVYRVYMHMRKHHVASDTVSDTKDVDMEVTNTEIKEEKTEVAQRIENITNKTKTKLKELLSESDKEEIAQAIEKSTDIEK